MCGVKRDSVCPTLHAVLILSQNHNFSKGLSLSLSSPLSYLPSVVKVKKQEHGISINNGNNNGGSYLGTPSITCKTPAVLPPSINPCASSNPSGVQMDTFEEMVVLFWVLEKIIITQH
jgi:hypothetical protein